jgi:phenylpropionate dioxygenase-like ring-hydroxylating dioxygenase large terminal subunit
MEEYLGEEIMARIERVLGGRKPVMLGRFTRVLPNNWKLYMENVKDSYHASILHTFFTTFEINRLSQKGAIVVDESGGHHVSYSQIDRAASRDAEYAQQNIRSETEYRLADPSLLQGFEEFSDGITLQILSVFPTFVLQQIQNSVAVRQIVPRGTGKTDLKWSIIGFADDSPDQRMARLKQANLGVCPRIPCLPIFLWYCKTNYAHNVLWEKATVPTIQTKNCCCHRACATGCQRSIWRISSAMWSITSIFRRWTRCTGTRNAGSRRTTP